MNIITIDGPSGCGKSTIAKRIAKEIGYFYINSGIYYRVASLIRLENNIVSEDELLRTINNTSIRTLDNHVYVNGEDVSDILCSNEINDDVGYISTLSNLRLLINDIIRKSAIDQNVVIDGRDTGTEIFPNANIKIFLDAAVDTRARRRYNQNVEKGIICTYADVLENIKKRDYYDLTRSIGKLRKADDAILIDTTNYDIIETIGLIKRIIDANIE